MGFAIYFISCVSCLIYRRCIIRRGYITWIGWELKHAWLTSIYQSGISLWELTESVKVPCQDSPFLGWDSVYSHPPLIDVPIVDNSIYRHSHNMFIYPNEYRSFVNRQSTKSAHWLSSQTQSGQPIILSVWERSLMNVHCFSSHFANFWIKLVQLCALQWKKKTNVVIHLFNWPIANRKHFKEPINVD
jgi:hypothetical protein